MIRFETENGHHEYWYDAGDVAKYLNIKDGKRIVGRNKFLQLLRANGCIMKDSNQPSQAWIQLGLAKYHMVERRFKKYGMTIFSEKSLGYIKNKIDSQAFEITFVKRIEKHKTVKLEEIC